jgi:hypothetical protein
MAYIELFHAQNTRDSFFYKAGGSIYSAADAVKSFRNEGYVGVATFEIETGETDAMLEEVYVRSQNITHAWRAHNPTRSTSVGDILRIGTDLYIVAGFGFEKLEG